LDGRRPFDAAAVRFACRAGARRLLVALAIAHAFELHVVGIEEEHGVVIVVVLAGGIDDGRAPLFEIGLQRIDIGAAPQAEGIVMEADIALAVFALLAFGIGSGDPEQRLAVGPAHHAALVLGLDVEAEKLHERRIEGLRCVEVADAHHQMIDPDNAHHDRFLLQTITKA